MTKLPGAFIFLLGLVAGVLMLLLIQYMGVVSKKDECEGLKYELEAVKLKEDILRMKITEQDSILAGLQKFFENPGKNGE
jgi:hypothetical protein